MKPTSSNLRLEIQRGIPNITPEHTFLAHEVTATSHETVVEQDAQSDILQSLHNGIVHHHVKTLHKKCEAATKHDTHVVRTSSAF